MTVAESAGTFIQSPLAVTLIGVTCATLVTLAGAAIRIVIQLARVESTISSIHEELHTLRSDPDVMRWSNYGRMVQATSTAEQHTGVSP